MSRNSMIIIPAVEQIAREMTDSSQIAIVLRRLWRLGAFRILQFGFHNVGYVGKILRKDFAVGIKVLCELEILNLSIPSRRGRIILHSQMVDMAIALKNRQVISHFFHLAELYRFKPGLLTYNPEFLIELLGDVQRIPPDLVIYTKILPGSALYRYAKSSPIKFEDWRA